MARPSAPAQLTHSLPEPPLSSIHKSMATPVEIAQQLARVDALHAQLKAETLRAQEFLLKLHRDEFDAPSQTQPKVNGRTVNQEETVKNHNSLQKVQKERKETAKAANVTHPNDGMHTVNDGTSVAEAGSEAQKEILCKCSCPHHSPLSPASEVKLKKMAGNHNLPLSLHTHVDEREVRDLEKRVRGLEGRVRGLEGLPPDREMALMEVERLRRELEGLARRREGLFEGLGGDLVENGSGKKGGKVVNGAGKALGNGQGNGKMAASGKAVGSGRR